MSTMQWKGWGAAALLATLGLAGCATLGVDSPPEEQVRKRAQARWDAAIAGEYEKAYALTAPSYRTLVSLQQYRPRVMGAQGVTRAEVVNVTCLENSCTARVRFDYTPFLGRGGMGQPTTNHMDERWVREDAQWWMYPTR